MSQELTDDERWLLEEIRAGRPALFATTPKTVIDPTVLRDHILGLALEDQNNSRRATGPWILHNAEFRRPFDLSDGRQASGGSLPAIEFVGCHFHAGFCADGADLERLAFRKCAFVAAEKAESPTSSNANPLEQPDTPGDASPIAGEPSFQRRAIRNQIRLRNCRIRTELRLESVAPTDRKEGILLVDGFAAVIGTNVVIGETLLRAPQGETSTTDPEPRYALDLSTAKIGSDVRLMRHVRLQGGLNMRDARVGGTFWGAGLKLSDGETPTTRDAIQKSGSSPRSALRLDTATIEGSVIFGTDESSLLQKAIRFQSQEARKNASAKVELLSFIECFRFTIDGAATLRNGTINGDLVISQGTVNGPLWMQGLTVRGDMIANPKIDDEIKRILLLDPRKSTTFPLEVSDSVWLNNARIDGDVTLEAAVKNALYVSGAEFNGFVTLAGSLPKFFAVGMRTAKNFTLAFKGLTEIKMEGAWVGGVLDLRRAGFSKGASLNLRNCEVHHAMEFAETVQTPKAVNPCRLSCYPGLALTEVLFVDQGRHKIAAYLTFDRRSDEPNSTFLPILLNGRSEPLKIPNLLKLEKEDQARAYLKLFCAYVWGEEGSFSIITDARDLGPSITPDPEILNIQCVKMTNGEGNTIWQAKAYERYSDGEFIPTFLIFIATFLIFKDTGYVEPKDYEPLSRYAGQEGDRPSTFSSPYRIIPVLNADTAKLIASYRSDFLGWTEFSKKKDDLDRFKREAMWWQTMLEQSFAGMSVSLNGASCRLLNDNTALSWKGITKLEIESFNYKEVSIPKDRGMDEIRPRLEMVRESLGLKKPEKKWRSRFYFALTILSLLLLLIVIFLYWVYATPLTTILSTALLAIVILLFWRRWRRQPSGFRTEPYTHLAQVLRERGDDGAAQEIEAEKIWQGAVDRGKFSRSGKLLQTFWWRPYRVMFRYGLSPGRAAVSMFLFWGLGTIAVSGLSHYQMLEAAITKVAPAAQVSPGQPTIIALKKTSGETPDVPCGDAIQPPLYAFELLTPILNLHQESRCELRDYPKANIPTFFNRQWRGLLTHKLFWEYAKALYMLVGSVISSLAILTFSGIARRWEQ